MTVTRMVAAVLLLILADVAAADSMRCGSALATIGDLDTEVLLKCGEPLSREAVAIKELTVRRRGFLRQMETTTEEKVEKWTYRPGGGQFMRVLTFQGGILVDIEQLDQR